MEGRMLSDQTNINGVARKLSSCSAGPGLVQNNKVSGCNITEGCRERHLDPIHVPEYSVEVGDYFLMAERSHYRDPDYMSNQPEITEKMRAVLVDWLVDVIIKFKLHAESYYLAVDIVDRYLSVNKVSRAKLQLVGITAVLLAAKHEEIWPPEIKDCVFISANTYTMQEVYAMERDIATTLRFKFSVPTTYPIACRFLETINKPQIVRDAVFFFLESASHCYDMLQFLPSRVAAASVLLGHFLVVINSSSEDRRRISPCVLWDHEMEHISRGITLEEVSVVANKLLEFTKSLCCPSSKLQAVRRKYLSSRYNAVASLECPSFLTGYSLYI